MNERINFNNIISIPVSPSDSKIDDALVEKVKDFKYIKLETKNECLIQEVSKLLFVGEKCYIFDRKKFTVFIFDSKGKYISKIAKQGKGFGEYSSIRDFDVSKDGIVSILDITRNSIFQYDSTGKFLHDTKLTSFATSVSSIDSLSFLTFHPVPLPPMPHGRLQINTKDGVRKSFFPFEDRDQLKSNLNALKPFYFNRSRNNILFNMDLTDTIFEISLDSLQVKAKYAIDFGINALTSELRNNSNYFFKDPTSISGGWNIDNVYENATHLTCTFNIDGKSWVLFYDKNLGKYSYSSCASCKSANPKILSDMAVKALYEDYFVSVVPVRLLASSKQYLDNHPERPNNFTKESLNLIKNYSINDNPVLVYFKI